jgi:Flp pilus assembly protein TadG
VEFALVLSVLLMIIMGMIDFGHAFFLRQIVTNASREGARAGVVFPHTDATVIQGNVETAVQKYWPLTDPPQVTVAPGTRLTGDPLTVTVTFTKTWWIINSFVPGMTDSTQIQVPTVMRYE